MSEQKQIDLSAMPIVELKSLAFDLLRKRDELNANIQLVSQAIQQKEQAQAEQPEPDGVKKK